jgi:hypothetical protein
MTFLLVASVRHVSFPAPHLFDPSVGKLPTGRHGPVLHQAVEYGRSGQSAIISGFQRSAILAKSIPHQSRCQIPIDGQALATN